MSRLRAHKAYHAPDRARRVARHSAWLPPLAGIAAAAKRDVLDEPPEPRITLVGTHAFVSATVTTPIEGAQKRLR